MPPTKHIITKSPINNFMLKTESWICLLWMWPPPPFFSSKDCWTKTSLWQISSGRWEGRGVKNMPTFIKYINMLKYWYIVFAHKKMNAMLCKYHNTQTVHLWFAGSFYLTYGLEEKMVKIYLYYVNAFINKILCSRSIFIYHSLRGTIWSYKEW